MKRSKIHHESLPVLLWGAGGHARFVAEIARLVFPGARIFFGVDENTAPASEEHVHHGWKKALAAAGGPDALFLPAMGNSLGRFRSEAKARRAGLRCSRAIHPSAVVAASAEAGECVVAGPCSVLGARAVVRRGTIINSGAIVEHDCSIGCFAHVSPGAVLCGGAHVGCFSWVGAGAVLAPGVSIGCGSMVGAGSVVIRDVGDEKVVAGNPARILRASSAEDPWYRPPATGKCGCCWGAGRRVAPKRGKRN